MFDIEHVIVDLRAGGNASAERVSGIQAGRQESVSNDGRAVICKNRWPIAISRPRQPMFAN